MPERVANASLSDPDARGDGNAHARTDDRSDSYGDLDPHRDECSYGDANA